MEIGEYASVSAVQQLHQRLFQQSDLDSSGGLSKEEFTSLAEKIAEVTGESGIAEDAEVNFNRADADGDGELTEAEQEAHIAAGPPEGGPARGRPPGGGGNLASATLGQLLQTSFDVADTDESGDVSLDEYLDFYGLNEEETAQKSPVNLEEIFSKIDTDSSGAISEEELQAHEELKRERQAQQYQGSGSLSPEMLYSLLSMEDA